MSAGEMIVGRDAELLVIREFLADPESGTRALLIHGEAGIGKTTIWQKATMDAAGLGYRVVTTRPTEAEAAFPLSALNDLFASLLDQVETELPPPQQEALEIAFLKRTIAAHPPGPLAISLGVLGLLRAASATAPLAVAIDDVQWLDESSAAVLDFVVRRLEREPLRILIAARTARGGMSTQAALPVARALEIGRLGRLEVAPLSQADLDRLISAALQLDLPPSATRVLHQRSGGNPFYATEIARALQRRGLRTLDQKLPLPESLSGLVRDRLAALSAAARQVTAHAAALSQPDRSTLEAALGVGTAREGLAEAEAAGVVFQEVDALRFGHPLLAAEAYADVAEADRREIHRRLAEVVTEAEERAKHLALAAAGPDEAVARELEAAAEHAWSRGATDAAADLAERAAELTPSHDAGEHRRSMAAGRYWFLAGDVSRARSLLESRLDRGPKGDRRAEILLRLAHVRELGDDWRAAGELFLEALANVRRDVRLKIEIKLQLGGVSHVTGLNWAAGARHVADAMRLAEELGDPRMLAAAIGPYATWRYMGGHAIDPGLEQRAAELAPWMDHLRTLDRPEFDFSLIRWSQGDTAGFRGGHEMLAAEAERTGDYSSLPFLLANLIRTDFLDGRPDVAASRLEQAERIARTTGQQTALAHVLSCRVELAARLGDAEAAHATAWEALDAISATGWSMGQSLLADLAELELSRGDAPKAIELLQSLQAAKTSPGRSSRPVKAGDVRAGPNFWAPIEVEALVGVGRLPEARQLLTRLLKAGRTKTRPRLRTAALASHALLAAAEGDSDGPAALLAEALEIARRIDDRWLIARIQLTAGEIHRRSRRRALAREALSEAAELFEFLGAKLWEARARDQLGRLAAARDRAVGLTPTQLEIAELVSGGLTNRQVADRLFMSAHTVEAHLSAIYRELRIKSRRELATALGERSARDSIRDSEPGSRDPTKALASET